MAHNLPPPRTPPQRRRLPTRSPSISHPSDIAYPHGDPFTTNPYEQRQGPLFPNGTNSSNNYNHSPAGPSNPNPSSIDIYDTSPRRRRVPRTAVDDAIFGFVENTRRVGDEDNQRLEDIELSPSGAAGYRGRAVGAFAGDQQWDGLGARTGLRISMRGGAGDLFGGSRFEGIERRDPDRLVVRNILYPPVSARGRNQVQRRRRKDPRLPRAWPESLEYIRFGIAKGILIIGAVLILMTIISGVGVLTKLLKGEKTQGRTPVLDPDRVTEYKIRSPWTRSDEKFTVDFYDTLATGTGTGERFNIAPYSARGLGWPGEKEGRFTIDPYETKTKAPWTRGKDEKQKVERAADRFFMDPYEAKEKQTQRAEQGEKFVIDPYEVRKAGWTQRFWGKGTREGKGKMKEQEERFVIDPYDARGVGWG